MKRPALSVVVMLSALALATSASFACPMCKDSIPSSDAAQAGSLPIGFNHSVYFVLVGFLTVLGSVIALIVKAIRDTGIRPGFQVVDPKRPSPPRE